jgi:preprotein translocase subunit SecG
MLYTTLLTLHTLFAFLLIVSILLQKSRGADLMTAGGASQTVFGSQGTNRFMTRLTSLLTLLFFTSSLALYILSMRQMAETTAQLGVTENTNLVKSVPTDPSQLKKTK